ncbi:hypothetical protein K438DRAFT_1574228 [Mycena galopus ATCC 62051]|nr:hypothetical protein K438DRAFT_1574228 [Mycena galopus ATCC 62051]
MSEQAPPQKRQRTEPDSGPRIFYKRSKVWMVYGDIVLQAEDMQFRVNRDVLARNSLAFHGMFGIPQPPGEAKIEGCPVLTLTGDSAKDLELFLGAFYNPFYYQQKLPFDVLACSLRLGRKYEAPAFKEDAKHRLRSEFPKTLDAWDLRQLRTRINGLELIRPSPAVYVDLLNLAYENGVYTVIPALAFRCLSLYTLLSAGFDREDGSRAVLPDATKVTLACALEAIQLFQRNNFEWFREEGEVVPNYDECEGYDTCEAHRQVMCKIECGEEKVDITYTLERWEKVAGGDWTGRLCKECEAAAKNEHETGRQRAWDLLPSFFGLEEWKDLKDID